MEDDCELISCLPECRGNMHNLTDLSGFPQAPKATVTKQLELSRFSNRRIHLKEGQSDLASC